MKVLALGPDWRNHEIITVLTELGHDVKMWNEELAHLKLDEWGIDFIISNGFGPIIKEPILTSFNEKIVNIHPAYLPHGRGIYPNFWSFSRAIQKE